MEKITLRNNRGAEVTLGSVGASIISIKVPDSSGRMEEVTLGHVSDEDYSNDPLCAGKTVGRFAGRISGASFSLNGHSYHLTPNDGENAIHGGPTGFQNRVWTMERIAADTVRFSIISHHLDEGYPGEIHVTVTYRWTDNNALHIKYDAVTDRPTILNLTNHTYFNLSSFHEPDILEHTLRIPAEKAVEMNDSFIPTGRLTAVAGTPLDYTWARPVGHGFSANTDCIPQSRGLNHCWILNTDNNRLHIAAELHSKASGRHLTVLTTLPSLVVYTGGWLDEGPLSRTDGKHHLRHSGVALECQYPPDFPNHPEFPAETITPEHPYSHEIIFIFSADQPF